MKLCLLLVLTACLVLGCQPPLEPVGESNATALAIEANEWQSSDTVISVDPQTFAETMQVVHKDLSPQVLPDGTMIYQITEYLPVYAGCDTAASPALCTQTALNAFVRDKLEYPRWARVQGVEGTVVASFVIDATGRVGSTSIERSLGDDLDRQVLQLIDGMPLWHPAFHGGQPVAVRYQLPVKFDLPLED